MLKQALNWFYAHTICKIKGHDWYIYKYSTGYFPYDIEKAGHCKRCHLDTHE